MTILFTGASGFLGSILTRSLQQQGHEVVSLNGERRTIDIRNSFRLDSGLKADMVIHAAGKAHSVPETEAEEKEFYCVNFEGTRNLCDALQNLDTLPPNFIFISTVAVYGLDEGLEICESHALNGRTAYAKSKILSEKWLTEWAAKRNVNLTILRLPLIAGPNPPGNLGSMIKGIKTGKYLSIGKSNARKSMVWAEDIAQLIYTASNKGGVYNLADDYHPSFSDLEAVIARSLGKSNPLRIPYWCARILAIIGDVIGPRFPIDSNKLRKITSTLTFDNGKAKRELNWKPSKVLDKIGTV